jgi:hypothetical protein
MPNTNCLQGIRCPQCKHENGFYIDASINAYVTDNGAEPAESTDYYWDENSSITCSECDHQGKVAQFREVTP